MMLPSSVVETAPETPFEIDFNRLDQIEIQKVAALLDQEIQERWQYQKVDFYEPSRKQRIFHEYGKTKLNRAIFACNRGGKTMAGCFEDYYHTTGKYPFWWNGKVWEHPITLLIIGISAKQVRESVQAVLLGDVDQWGTGTIPKESIVPGSIKMIHGVSGAVDRFQVYHKTGGISNVILVGSEAGLERIRGLKKCHAIHADEEWQSKSDPTGLYGECLTRLWDTEGIFYWTVTPQSGVTPMINMYWQDGDEICDEDNILVRMEIDEVTHLTKKQIERIKRQTEKLFPHMADARLRGIPTIGAGLIYPFADDEISIDEFDVLAQQNLRFLGASDIGFANSYTAPGWFAEDRNINRTVLFDCDMIRHRTPDQLAPTLRRWDKPLGFKVPFVLPKDAKNQNPTDGQVVAQMYRKYGVNVLNEHAGFEDGRGLCVEEGIAEVRMGLGTGALKILNKPHMKEWFKQKNSYSREEEGKIVKTHLQQYDLMDMTRYGWIMLLRKLAKARVQMQHGSQQMKLAGLKFNVGRN